MVALGVGVAALLPSESAEAAGKLNPGSKPWRGLFPIGQTPFTPDNKLDLDCLAAEVNFCNRGRVPGFIWRQSSRGWTTLTEKERLDGAETIMAAGKGGKTSLIIGVQALGGNIDAAILYAKHAAQHNADGLISLPPAPARVSPKVKRPRGFGLLQDPGRRDRSPNNGAEPR